MPGAAYDFTGLIADEVVPSPKDQEAAVGDGEDVFVNGVLFQTSCKRVRVRLPGWLFTKVRYCRKNFKIKLSILIRAQMWFDRIRLRKVEPDIRLRLSIY